MISFALGRIPKIGDPVIRNGDELAIVGFGGQDPRNPSARGIVTVEAFEDALIVVIENKQFRYKLRADDLRWNDELGAFYSWGTLLSDEQKRRVTVMRDAGELPARETRQRGHGPAGGEHLNLYLALFKDRRSITKERIADYRERFAQKLVEGYADPDADDSTEG